MIQDISQYLIDADIRPSHARIKVFEFLMNSKEHPRAIDIYNELAPELPTLSKMTVYNTLNLFVHQGIVKQITIDGYESRFDADIDGHCHLQCQACGKVMDVEMNHEQIKSLMKLEGIHITDHQTYLKGYCKECARNLKNN